MSDPLRPSVTGRWARSQPEIQNLPGSFADTLMWAMERNDYSEAWRRLLSGDLEPQAGDRT